MIAVAPAPANPVEPAVGNKVDFAALVKAYRDLGLPIPPADAPLIRFAQNYDSNRDEPDKIFQLAFQLPAKPGDKSVSLLIGTEKVAVPIGDKRVAPIKPEAVNVADVEPALWCAFSVNAGLATAIQCKIRGWDSLADALLQKSVAVTSLPGLSIYNKDDDVPLPPMEALGYVAWAHYGNQLATPGADRATIARQIRILLARWPSLKTDDASAILASLDASLVPSHAKPGSIDAMIDDLLEINTDPMRVDCGEAYVPDARDKLLLRGFEAVPALIAHIDDDRLTSGVEYGRGNIPNLNSRVSNFVCDLLEQLAGPDDIGKHWLDPERGRVADKAAVLAWWQKASAMGEEAYAVANVLPPAARNVSGPNQAMLDLITRRYPKHLIGLYKIVLDNRPDLSSGELADAIAKSSLERDEKLPILLRAAADKNLERREWALNALGDLDPESFVKLYMKTLDELPHTPREPYWRCPESRFGGLATLTADPRAWDALKRNAARVDIGLRMQLLVPLTYGCCCPNKHPRESMELLAAFLDDGEIRDIARNAVRYQGPVAFEEYPKLSMRDFAAMCIASLLKTKLNAVPSKKWKAEDWSAYRKEVAAAMKRELQ